MDDDEIFEALDKFDAGKENFGFDKEIKLTGSDPREKQRKIWAIKMSYLRSSGEKMLPHLLETDRERSLLLEAEDVRGGRLKKVKKKGYYSEKFIPDASFDKEKVYQVLERVVTEYSETMISKFDVALSKEYSLALCPKVLAEVYKLNFDRHKILVIVRVVEDLNQYSKSMISFLWDCDFDGHVHYTYQGSGYVIIVSVFGFYVE